MRDGSRWKCANCGHREASPLDPECPECGVTGDRYPVESTPNPSRFVGAEPEPDGGLVEVTGDA